MSVSSRRRAHFHIFTRSSRFALQSWKSVKIGSNMELQIRQNATKTPSEIHVFFTPVFDSFFDQKWLPKWSPKWPWTPLFFSHFSNVVPDLALGPTSVNFWVILGAPRLHFGLILALFGGPQSFNFGTHGLPTAYVLEFVDNLFLEQITSHTDSGTSYPRPMF